jgi:hypothetical protein
MVGLWQAHKADLESAQMKFHTASPTADGATQDNWRPNYTITWQDETMTAPQTDEVMVFQVTLGHVETYFASTQNDWVNHEEASFTYDADLQEWLRHGKSVEATWKEIKVKFRTVNIDGVFATSENWRPNYAITWQDTLMDRPRTDEVMVFLSKSDKKFHGITKDHWLRYGYTAFSYDEDRQEWLLFGKPVRATWRELEP